MDEVIDRLDTAGHDTARLGSAVAVADRMVAAIPMASPFDLEFGPYYTTANLAKFIGRSKQSILETAKQNKIIWFTTADGHRVYPSFQFGPKGALLADLPALTAILSKHLSAATIALWLVTEHHSLGGTPAEWMLSQKPTGPVMDLAAAYMSQFEGAPKCDAP